MSTKVHFINVGQGNMTLLQLDDGKIFLYDCNITNDNKSDVINYITDCIGRGAKIDVFICSHRDADHMRGIKIIHQHFPIKHIWDSGVPGTTTDSSEYLEYMQLRRQIGYTEVSSNEYFDAGNTHLLIMNSKNNKLPNNANAQSIVIKVIHQDKVNNRDYGSVLLTGDTDVTAWEQIHSNYGDNLKCSVLLASHHGSSTYFQKPGDDSRAFTDHIAVKSPDITVISVGNNAHGHPHASSLELYKKYTRGSANGNKIFRTDEHGHMHLELKDGGGWRLNHYG